RNWNSQRLIDCERTQPIEAGHSRRDQQTSRSQTLRLDRTAPHRLQCSAHMREIQAVPPSLHTRVGDRFGTTGHSLVEWTEGLIEQVCVNTHKLRTSEHA